MSNSFIQAQNVRANNPYTILNTFFTILIVEYIPYKMFSISSYSNLKRSFNGIHFTVFVNV